MCKNPFMPVPRLVFEKLEEGVGGVSENVRGLFRVLPTTMSILYFVSGRIY